MVEAQLPLFELTVCQQILTEWHRPFSKGSGSWQGLSLLMGYLVMVSHVLLRHQVQDQPQPWSQVYASEVFRVSEWLKCWGEFSPDSRRAAYNSVEGSGASAQWAADRGESSA